MHTIIFALKKNTVNLGQCLSLPKVSEKSNGFKSPFIPALNMFLIIVIAIFAGCHENHPLTHETGIPLPNDVQVIFMSPNEVTDKSCTSSGCHSSSTWHDPESGTHQLDFKDWESLMNSGAVIPYNSYWSHLISVVNSDTNIAPVSYIDNYMSDHKLDSAKVRVLMNWIDNGAQSRNGNVAFTSLPNDRKGFITCQASDHVAIIDTKSKIVTRLVSVGARSQVDAPHYITVDHSKRDFYVTLMQEGFVEKYDVNTYQQTGRMAAGNSPGHVVVEKNRNVGYVSNFGTTSASSGVKQINTETMSIMNSYVDLRIAGTHPLALSSDDRYLFVASLIGEYLYRFDTHDFLNSDSLIVAQIDPSVPPGGNGTGNFNPIHITMSPGDSLILVSCAKSNEIRVYRSDDLSQFVPPVPVGLNPIFGEFTPDGRYFIVCNRNDSTVSVLNYPQLTMHTTIYNAGVQPHGVDFTPDGEYAIVTMETQSSSGGHHPQVGNKLTGISKYIRLSDFSVLPTDLIMGSFPAGIYILK